MNLNSTDIWEKNISMLIITSVCSIYDVWPIITLIILFTKSEVEVNIYDKFYAGMIPLSFRLHR